VKGKLVQNQQLLPRNNFLILEREREREREGTGVWTGE
jgi:hypothetical protein